MSEAAEKVIPKIELSESEAMALAQMCKRMCWEDIDKLSSRFTKYDGRLERDVMLDGVSTLRRALAEAGFAPR